MKTKEGWEKSKQNLTEYLQVGDAVDDEMYYYFIEVLPPACMSSRCVQIGEPYTHSAAGAEFMTLEKQDGQWVYAGIKAIPKGEKCLYVN